jgi:glutamate-ammonia-ligase adenylyltransferase
MTADDVETLTSAYQYLRKVENHIQQYQDKQTHDLPTDPTVQAILAYSMGEADWRSFKQHLDDVRQHVHAIFDTIFSLADDEKNEEKSTLLWTGNADDDLLHTYLNSYGFADCNSILLSLKSFKKSPSISRLSTKGFGVLNRLMPSVIEALQDIDNQDETIKRILTLFESVAGRNVYLSLLAENSGALNQFVTLVSASPWISEYLALYPVLFDELLDARSLYDPLQKAELAKQLAEELASVDQQDLEELMIKLRQFKHLNVLRVAAADIMGAIPLMVVSDYLTYIAEVILEQVIDQAWNILTEKHGSPPNTNSSTKGFAILGLGKLGGCELGYGSDLDMIFLYDSHDVHAMTDGKKPLSSTQFYVRLGLKIKLILDTKMLSGILYEADLRLRPSGNSGLLATYIKSYESYLKNDAWTWEHQALVRGRFIAGDSILQDQFEQIRHTILALPRKINDLKVEVREMREKMRESLAPKKNTVFHLKQSKGGIADIEFIVQFAVLANASTNKGLVTYTDNTRLLEELIHDGFLSKDDAEMLKSAYCQYRDYGHKLVLQGKNLEISSDHFVAIRDQVSQLWHKLMD